MVLEVLTNTFCPQVALVLTGGLLHWEICCTHVREIATAQDSAEAGFILHQHLLWYRARHFSFPLWIGTRRALLETVQLPYGHQWAVFCAKVRSEAGKMYPSTTYLPLRAVTRDKGFSFFPQNWHQPSISFHGQSGLRPTTVIWSLIGELRVWCISEAAPWQCVLAIGMKSVHKPLLRQKRWQWVL